MNKEIKHIEDGKNTWIISKDGRRFLIEFSVSENTISEGAVQFYPVDEAHFEPAIVVVTAEVTRAMIDFGEDEEEDWVEVSLMVEDEKEIIDYIEISHEL